MFEWSSGGKLRFMNYLRQLRQPKAYFCFKLVLFLYLCLLFTFSTEVILKSVLKALRITGIRKIPSSSGSGEKGDISFLFLFYAW